MNPVTLHAPMAGWLCLLDEVPDPVFAERMMGDGFAIDPTEGVLRAPADGVVVALPASSHALTLALANGVELLLHIGLETVALQGEGFAPKVAVGDRVCTGDPLIAFDLDAVARRAKDMVTPIVAVSEGAIVLPQRLSRRVTAGDPIATITVADRAGAPVEDPVAALTHSITVRAPHGIHARPAARIVALLKGHAAEVTLVNGDHQASARSVTALLALGARHGDMIEARASGADAAAALDALAAFADARFGDEEVPPAPPPLPPRADDGGVSAAPGLAIGRALQFRPARLDVPRQGAGIAHERRALTDALRTVAAAQRGAIAEAHRALLDDPALMAAAEAHIAEGSSAAYAWASATGGAADALRATGDALLQERVADLEDLEQQVVAHLLGEPPAAMPAIAPDTILIARDLLPSQFLALPLDRVGGICTAEGGPTAHVAILAASAGVPMLVAAGAGVLDIADGTTVLLDADACRIEHDPPIERLAMVATLIATRREDRAADLRAAQEPCGMADGTRIEIFANLGSAEDAARAVAAGAEGCGLLRTEFLFLDRATAPDEEEQRALYTRIAATLGTRPLIVRTLDIGGDKPVPYLPQPAEENPALGLRGIRLGLARPDLLAVQFRAILRAIPGEQCRIMLPMIVDAGELAQARAILDTAIAEVGRTDPVQLGVMIETPAAALLADQIAASADFLSIGSNDLTQYALACDRGNAAVSAKVDALHPAVLRLIRHAATGARQHGRWTGICGGLASDPAAAPLLIGLGLTELSAVPAAVPALKAKVRRLDMGVCVALAERACAASSPAAVRAMLAEMAE